MKTMATEAQIAANWRNAKKSTGPKTPEGKKAVSQNAVRHGLLATTALVRGRTPKFTSGSPVNCMKSISP